MISLEIKQLVYLYIHICYIDRLSYVYYLVKVNVWFSIVIAYYPQHYS